MAGFKKLFVPKVCIVVHTAHIFLQTEKSCVFQPWVTQNQAYKINRTMGPQVPEKN